MKQIILFRHGEAVDSFAYSINDEERFLTHHGKTLSRQMAELLKQQVGEISLILSSPLKRALETAAIIADVFQLEDDQTEVLPSLAFGVSSEILIELNHYQGETICLTGHEPTLGYLASLALDKERLRSIQFKKSGWIAIAFKEKVQPGAGSLLAMSPGKIIRERR